MRNSNCLLIIFFLLSIILSCGNAKDFDREKRLYATNLVSSEGDLDFSPMQHEDSSDVNNFTPPVYSYRNDPYTGKVVSYTDDKKIMLEGNLKNGLAEGEWKFYYPSGVLQIEGIYHNGYETGFWKSYFGKDRLKIVKYYDEHGYMLMRKEYYDSGRIKNYQNIKCPQFGDRERRIEFTYNGEIDYIDAEREVGSLPPKELNELLKNDGLLRK